MACGGSESSQQGYAVFIVNIEENGNKGDFEFQHRNGAREDSGNLQTVFSDNLGFNWINRTSYWHQNLTVGRWDHRKKSEHKVPNDPKECCLHCHIQSLDHSKSKCFVLAISSHGQELEETELIFSDGKSINLTEIFDALTDENCPSLKGIPRIIILHACRSNLEDKELVEKMQDHGVGINLVEMSPQSKSGTSAAGTSNRTLNQPHTIPTADQTFQLAALNKMPENFLLVYPAVSGQRAQCNETYGSWLIHGLKEMFLKHYADQKSVNILHLLTLVSGYIARERATTAYKRKKRTDEYELDESGKKIIDEDRSGVKNAVCFHHRLMKPLILSLKDKESTELEQPNFFDFGQKKKKTGKKMTVLSF